MKFHHIGYLTNNFNKSLDNFKILNYKKKDKIINDDLLQVQIQFLKNPENNLIELVKPYKKNIGLNNILEKKIFAYHFAYKVYDLKKSIRKLKKQFEIIVNPVPAKAFNNKKVSFMRMKNGFIIELIQK